MNHKSTKENDAVSSNGMAKRSKTASVGLYNELIAQAKFAQDPDKIVFVPAMGIGPIDMVVLDINTGEYQAYDVKTANYRKSDYTPKDRYVRKAGSLINRGLTELQKKLKVKEILFSYALVEVILQNK